MSASTPLKSALPPSNVGGVATSGPDTVKIQVDTVMKAGNVQTPAPPSPKAVERENKNAPLKAPSTKSSSNAPKATASKGKKEPKADKEASAEKKPRQPRKQTGSGASASKGATKKATTGSSSGEVPSVPVETSLSQSQLAASQGTETVIDIVSAESSKESAVFSGINHNDNESLCFSESDAGEVDPNDRLISSSTPLAGASKENKPSLDPPYDDEVSNYYVSPSCSRLSTINVDAGRVPVLNINEALREAAFRLDEPGIAAAESDSAKEESDGDVEDNGTPINNQVDTPMEVEVIDVTTLSSPQPSDAAISEEHSDSAGRRKRKPANFFDPTPVSMRNVKKTKSSPSSTNNETAVETAAESVQESFAMTIDMTDDVVEVTVAPAISSEDSSAVNYVAPTTIKAPEAQKKKRAPKPKKLADDASGELAAMIDGPAVVTPTPVVVTLPPDQQAKVDKLLERINQFANELIALERCADVADNGLELDNLLEQSITFLNKKSSTEISSSAEATSATDATSAAVPTSSQAESELAISQVPAAELLVSPSVSVESLESQFVKAIIARTVHGSAKNLSQLIEIVKKNLCDFYQSLLIAHTEEEITSDQKMHLTLSQKDALSMEVNRVANLQNLGDEIKSVAKRESLGHRLKNSHAFEDDSLAAMWRWEAFSPQHFLSANSISLMKEAKSVRGRYSRVVKALSKVVEQVSKVPYDESKVAPLEEKVSKAVTEVEKAKEKRREIELKRERDAQEKAAKEALKEQKRKEKEEADLLKKQQQEAAAKAKADLQAEKEKKANEEREKLEEKKRKQQNLMMQFIKPSGTSSGVKSSTSCVSSSANSFTNVVKSSSSVASSSSAATAKPTEVINIMDDEDHYKSFIEQINKGMTMAEVLAEHRKQRQLRNAATTQKHNSGIKKCRTIRISVMASSSSTKPKNAFEENDDEYIEMREKVVNNKIKTFFFHEDYRPAYVGTFSKNSSIISGRNPLGKDREVFNYEYDSEEEWEEEEEGEDIMESGDEDEDEEEGNELEYDDMFRRDDDFGSDVDEDGEDLQVMTVNAMNRVRQEVLGPRFVRNIQTNELTNAVDNSMNVTKYTPDQIITIGDKSKIKCIKHNCSSATSIDIEMQFTPCAMNEDDDMYKLSAFSAVVFAPSFLNLSMNSKSTNSEKEKTSKSTKDKSNIGTTDSTGKKKEKNVAVESTAGGEEGNTAEVVNKEKMMKGFDETKIADLIRLIHGKKEGVDKLINTFHESNPLVAKAQIKKRISEISEKTKHADGYGSLRFIVKHELLVQHCPELAETPVAYTPVPDKKKKRPASSSTDKVEKTSELVVEVADEATSAKKARMLNASETAASTEKVVSSPLKPTPTTAETPVAPSTPQPARTITSLFQAVQKNTPSKSQQ